MYPCQIIQGCKWANQGTIASRPNGPITDPLRSPCRVTKLANRPGRGCNGVAWAGPSSRWPGPGCRQILAPLGGQACRQACGTSRHAGRQAGRSNSHISAAVQSYGTHPSTRYRIARSRPRDPCHDQSGTIYGYVVNKAHPVCSTSDG